MSARNLLHQLVDELSGEEISTAERILRRLHATKTTQLSNAKDKRGEDMDSAAPSVVFGQTSSGYAERQPGLSSRGVLAAQLLGGGQKFSPDRDAVAELVTERTAEG